MGRGEEGVCECRGRSGVVCEWRRGREGVGVCEGDREERVCTKVE